MRPSQDILMVNAESLIALHQYGGSLNLEGLAHIALHKATLWATGLWGIKVGRGHPDVQRRIDLLNFIKAQCSTLKSLSIVLYNETTYEDPTTNSRLLDLNNDLLKLDLRDRSGEQVPRRKVSPHYEEQ
ncbi:predicted protein [Sclerotinia sclerotiorum 1980 UF-70]|uniref:Uncharacterized protein n=2 Tax=Sclerotinia sclerotiorum (strain ATCC 18683 / 1980 / Ss-1) TaxID=665079 RepID=A0A1D9Q0K7_SCLS1|nr:predicted protein [Sclerotinia sclerotiorum 1980 UF-70]APA08342.1 hypothetical protein sscle_03g031120 [Sclerotinia sclerotiorum 1980 UF-70]EDN98413.1 predicted protein [Sclerotinia sclerotiorum 1980 UF-70]